MTTTSLDGEPTSAPGSRGPRIGLGTRILYGLGSVAFGVKDNGFAYFLLIYYNQVLGLSSTAAGAALMIALIWDAFSDPVIGYVSDHWHSRWGRRHPFMYFSALPFAVSFYLLWVPPEGLDQQGLFFYLLGMAILVRSALTLYEVPSSSLVPELTESYDERTALLGFRFFFGWYGGLTMAVLAYTVFLAATPEYPNGILNPAGYRSYGALAAFAIALSVLVSAAGTHRYIRLLKQPPERRPTSIPRIFRELAQTLANRNFLAIFLAAIFIASAMGLTAALNIYVMTYFWELRSKDLASIIFFQFAAALIAPFAIQWLTRRFDKRRAALGLALISVVFGATPVLLRLVGWFPANGSEWLLPLLRGHSLIEVTILIMVSIALTSMIADIAEENELEHGRREEGVFFAARNFAMKATSGIGAFLAGVALDVIHFPENAVPGQVDPDVIFRLGIIVGPVLMSIFLIGVFFLRGYRITREGHERNLEALALRADKTRDG